jgi:staphylococcal nuclease domain-containing protein 1
MHQGIVKEVKSGDTLVVMGPPTTVPPAELNITLSGIIAPRVARRDTEDEPYAWAAREYLRQLIIGQMVEFTPPSEFGGRQFCSVFLRGENVVLNMVTRGLVSVKDKGSGVEFEQLQQAEAAAQEAGLGIHAQGHNPYAVRPPVDRDYDVQKWVSSLPRREPVTAIVEWVRDPCTFGCLVVPAFKHVLVNLSGVAGPRVVRGENEGDAAKPQPHYYEAKHLSEALMLNRTVEITFETVERNGNITGSILTAEGNIAEELLRRGYAKLVQWSAKESVAGMAALQAAETHARKSMQGLWADGSSPSQPTSSQTVPVTVVEVRSGDTMFVVPSGGAADPIQVSLASVRCPRLANARAKEEGTADDEPWGFEAKEYLRSAVIGQEKLSMRLDYKRAIGAEGAERPFVSLYNSKRQNIAAKMIREGLASCQPHRENDERSADYAELQSCEADARNAHQRLHSSKPAPVHRFNDMSATAQKAHTFLGSLQRDKPAAVVEYCMSGSRFKMMLRQDNGTFTFSLSGIRTPNHGGNRDAEPFGPEALAFTKSIAMQREATVEVETCDKRGAFLGQLFVGKARDNLAVELLKQGLGWLDERSASRSPYYSQLEAASEAAKQARLGVWQNYEETAAPASPADEEESSTPKRLHLEVHHVDDGNSFWAHVLGDDGQQMLNNRLNAFQQGNFAAPGPGGTYKVGQHCLAPFVDGNTYRAKVIERLADKNYRVFYIDYGNTHVVAQAELQPFPSDKMNVPEMAWKCSLAFTSAPELSDDFGTDAKYWLCDAAMQQTLDVQLVSSRGGVLNVIAARQGDDTSVRNSMNCRMLETGLTRTVRGAAARDMPDAFHDAEERAQRKHSGLWRYGDSRADSDEEGRRPRHWNA